MVLYPRDPKQPIRLAPNRSLDWPDMRRAWMIIAASTVAISAGAALAGYWMPLPFAGLEVTVLGIAFWQIARHQQRFEEIRLTEDRLVVVAGDGREERQWDAHPAWVTVRFRPATNRDRRPRLLICSHGQHVEIGSFLSGDEKKELADRLSRQLPRTPFR